MANFTCCTIVAHNYLPRARVLAKSLNRHHPDVTLWVLVIDGEPIDPADNEPFATLSLGDVGLGGELGREMAAIYSVLEFCDGREALGAHTPPPANRSTGALLRP